MKVRAPLIQKLSLNGKPSMRLDSVILLSAPSVGFYYNGQDWGTRLLLRGSLNHTRWTLKKNSALIPSSQDILLRYAAWQSMTLRAKLTVNQCHPLVASDFFLKEQVQAPPQKKKKKINHPHIIMRLVYTHMVYYWNWLATSRQWCIASFDCQMTMFDNKLEMSCQHILPPFLHNGTANHLGHRNWYPYGKSHHCLAMAKTGCHWLTLINSQIPGIDNQSASLYTR